MINLSEIESPILFHGDQKTDYHDPAILYFDINASIGIAWSDDLMNWSWLGMKRDELLC